MTDARYKELMESVGMPNSRSLLQALQQATMEAALEEREACAKTCDNTVKNLYLSQDRSDKEMALLVAATDDCACAIRNR